MALDVIGAGFGRTGTESLKRALEMLGFGPCYHMYEVLPHPDRVETWRGVLGGTLRPDWDRIFDGYRATVDWPTAHYWREIADHYPEARVVLSVRPPESWYASMDKTILSIIRGETDPDTIPYKLGHRVFGGSYDDPEHVMGVFTRHIEEVRAALPPERLLVYELGSGWGPLCGFLGCPEPADPYPIGNDGEEFHQRVAAVEAERKARASGTPD